MEKLVSETYPLLQLLPLPRCVVLPSSRTSPRLLPPGSGTRTISSRSKAVRACRPSSPCIALHRIRQAGSKKFGSILQSKRCRTAWICVTAPRHKPPVVFSDPPSARLSVCACALCTVQKLACLLAFALPGCCSMESLTAALTPAFFFLLLAAGGGGGGGGWRRERASRRRWRSRAAQRGQPKVDSAPWARRSPAEEERQLSAREGGGLVVLAVVVVVVEDPLSRQALCGKLKGGRRRRGRRRRASPPHKAKRLQKEESFRLGRESEASCV